MHEEKSNELTGSVRLYRAASSDRRGEVEGHVDSFAGFRALEVGHELF